MAWPLPSHFSVILQNPQVAFRDPRLRACQVERNAMGQPRPWAGAFAVVYKGITTDDQRPFAIRTFSSESPQRRDRYRCVSEYLKRCHLGCMVDFEYRDESIRSSGDGQWYPLVLMDWVEGVTLFESKTDRHSANWLFTMHVQDRASFCTMMADRQIEVSVVHIRNDQHEVFGPQRHDLPVTDAYAKTNISIPLHNHLTDEQVTYIIEAIKRGW